MAHKARNFVVNWATQITPSVRHIAFSAEDKEPIQFQAGQFITLNIQGPEKIIHRSYSITNAPGDGTVELACAYVEGGIGTRLLFGLKPNDVISVSGPFGLFTLKEEAPARYILIATGTGVAPYRSMLKDLAKRFSSSQSALEVVLILGVRTRDELLFGQEFVEFSKQYPQFKFYACYSQHPDNAIDSLLDFERKGRIQTTFETLSLHPENDIVYLCGNPNMIDETFLYLTDKGFDKKTVRREKYVFSH